MDGELNEEAIETVVGGAGATAGLYDFNPQPEPPGFGPTHEIEEREQNTTIVR
jgi:hypothetical protein